MVKSVNSELEKKCKEFNSLLKNNSNIQEYMHLKQQLEAPQYQQLQTKIVELQKQLVNEVDQGNDITLIKDQLQALHDEYFKNPLVVNYEYIMEEVNSLFQYINDYINGAIQKNAKS